MPSYRLWVSEDRCLLMRMWYDTPSDYVVGKPANVEIATRESPAHTWGPPVPLTEEKVMMSRPVSCARCRRRLRDGRWIYSRFTHLRYCYPGEGCAKRKVKV